MYKSRNKIGAGAEEGLPTKSGMPRAPKPSGGRKQDVTHFHIATSETEAVIHVETKHAVPPSQTTRNKIRAGAVTQLSTKAHLPRAPKLSGGRTNCVIHDKAAASETEAGTTVQAIHAMPPSQTTRNKIGAGAVRVMPTNGVMPRAPKPSGGPVVSVILREDATSETEAVADLATIPMVPPSQTIHEIMDLQRQRIFCIKSQSRCDRSCEAFIARFLGYSAPREKDADRSGEKERKAIFARAAAIRKAVEKGGRSHADYPAQFAPEADREGRLDHDAHAVDALSVCTPIIVNSASSRLAWDNLRDHVEKRMRTLAKTLPIYSWAKGISGFGDLGLAIIIGETGDLHNYATKERVWKRLGLAVIDGHRQQRRKDEALALAHGFNPRRRAEVWSIADSLFKHQWTGDKDEDGKDPKKSGKPVAVKAHPTGPYGEIYALRKAYTLGREGWSDKRRDDDARRIMTKALIERLWRAWTHD